MGRGFPRASPSRLVRCQPAQGSGDACCAPTSTDPGPAVPHPPASCGAASQRPEHIRDLLTPGHSQPFSKGQTIAENLGKTQTAATTQLLVHPWWFLLHFQTTQETTESLGAKAAPGKAAFMPQPLHPEPPLLLPGWGRSTGSGQSRQQGGGSARASQPPHSSAEIYCL